MIETSPMQPNSMLPVANVGTDGNPPKHRLKNANDAQNLVWQLWNAAKPRMLKNAAIQGQIDGNPPYSYAKLRAQGRANDPNFNTLEAKATRSAAMVPYWDLFTGTGHYVDVQFDDPDPKKAQKVSEIVSEEYDRMLKRWRNFNTVMQRMLTDYVTFGKGFLAYETSQSWRFKKVDYYRALVPNATPIDSDEWEIIVIMNKWTCSTLWKKIRDKAQARKLGWNIDETMAALAQAAPLNPNVPFDPIATQQALFDNDLYVSAVSNTVQCATVLIKEFDGKWSECVVRVDMQSANGQPPSEMPVGGYMYESRNKYESLFDAVLPFFLEAGSTSWNGATGLGRDIFTAMQLKDRLACAQAQSAFLRSSLVLQPRQGLDKSRLNALTIGAITWIPPEVEVQQSSILGDLNSLIEVSRELDMTIQKNTGVYRPTLEKGSGNPQTLGEFQMKFAQATMLSESAVDRFYTQLDTAYESQFRKVIKIGKGDGDAEWAEEARLFQERCKDRGVTKDMFERMEIKAWRNIGAGSIGMRSQALSNFMSLYPLLKPQGQEALLRDVITTSGSYRQAVRYMPPQDWTGVPNNDQWAALQENASIKVGAPVTWTPSQNNIIHAQTHLEAGSQAAESLQQGGDPMQVLMFLEGIGQHTLVHLQQESANKTTSQAQAVLLKQWKQLAGVADELKRSVMQMQQQAAQQQQKTIETMSDAELAQFETQKKLELSGMKAAGTLQLKKQRQDAELALKQQKQSADIAMQDATTAASIHRDGAKTASEINQKTAKTIADANIENAENRSQ